VGGHRSQNVDALDIAAALPYAVQRRLPVEPRRDVVLYIPIPSLQLNARNRGHKEEINAHPLPPWHSSASTTT
jgi:hypothetical protein